MTWSHCAPFPINSFIDCPIGAIFSGAVAMNGLVTQTHESVSAHRTYSNPQGQVLAHAQAKRHILKSNKLLSSAKSPTSFAVLFQKASLSLIFRLHSMLSFFFFFTSCSIPRLDFTLHSLNHRIVNLQSGCTDGSLYLVHKYICLLILGPTPAQNQIREPCVNVCAV